MKLEPTPTEPVEPLSPARQLRADRQNELARVDAAVDEQLALAARLDPILKAVAPARAALAAFDAEQAEGMSRYAQGLTTGRPTSSGTRRAELVAEIANAEQDATAAKAAQEAFRAVASQAGAPAAQLKAAIASAERLVLIEDAELLLPKVKAAIAEAFGLHKEIASLRYAVAVSADISHATEVGRALAAFDTARAIAEERPRDEEPAPTFHLPRYAVEAAGQMRSIMNTPTTFSSAQPAM
jgi:hypothetical protein